MTEIVEKITSRGEIPDEKNNLKSAFKGNIRKGSVETSNSLKVLSRTLITMLAPLSYVLILGITAYFTFYHALFGLHFNQGAPLQVAASLYVVPLLSGLSLTILLLRPFFHLRRSNQHRFKLDDNDGAEFLQLITQIQQQLKVTLNCKVELSMLPIVSTEPQGLSLKPKQAITLVVGLPLIKAMTSQQLSALICHELAHYKHAPYRHAYRSMTLVDQWFDDCVQGRDGWKAYFSELENNGSNSAYVVSGLIGKIAIMANDTILRYLHKAYRKLSIPIFKHLDRDADQSAVLLSGSLCFSESLKLLARTSESWQSCQFRLLNQTSRSLPDNFADEVYVYANVDEVAELESLTPYLPISWSYHGELEDRVEFAQHEDVAGVLHLAKAATELFKHFPALCKSVTPAYYREYGIEFSPNSLKPVASNIEQQAAQDHYRSLIDEFTASTFSPTVVWDVKEAQKLTRMTVPQIQKQLNSTVKLFRHHLPAFQDAHIHSSNTQKDALNYHLSTLRLKHGYISEQQISHQTENHQHRKSKLLKESAALDAYSHCIGMRLSAAVMLDTDKATLMKTLSLLTNLQRLQLMQKLVDKGQQFTILIAAITTQLYSNQETKLIPDLNTYTERLNNINRHLFAKLSNLPGELKDVDSISTHIQQQMKMKLLPGRDGPDKARDLFCLLKTEFCSLNIIVTGQLVEYAMKNELAHNIEPITLILKPKIDKSA